MTKYLTEKQYNDLGYELVDSDSFERYNYKAKTKIDKYTFRRFINDEKAPEELKMCMCELIDMLYSFDKTLASYQFNANGEYDTYVKKESNDGVSVEYGSRLTNVTFDSLSTARKTFELSVYNLIRDYLNGVKNECGKLVLYRGID